jgi:chromosome segregation ATPase
MEEQTWFEKILADLEGDPEYECEKSLIYLQEEFIKAGKRITELEQQLMTETPLEERREEALKIVKRYAQEYKKLEQEVEHAQEYKKLEQEVERLRSALEEREVEEQEFIAKIGELEQQVKDGYGLYRDGQQEVERLRSALEKFLKWYNNNEPLSLEQLIVIAHEAEQALKGNPETSE